MSSKGDLRRRFREEVFARDSHGCVIGGSTEDLDAHHITDRHCMPNGGYTIWNGVSLCPEHHWDAEKYHRSRGKDWVKGMHPDDLYSRIGSSLLIAVLASGRVA